MCARVTIIKRFTRVPSMIILMVWFYAVTLLTFAVTLMSDTMILQNFPMTLVTFAVTLLTFTVTLITFAVILLTFAVTLITFTVTLLLSLYLTNQVYIFHSYDPSTGIYGMNFIVVLDRSRYRVACRRRCKAYIGIRHRVTKDDAMKWFQMKYECVIMNKSRNLGS